MDSHLLNQVFLLFSASILVLITFSRWLQHHWLPLPLVGLVFGVLLGPHVLDWVPAAHPGPHHRDLLLDEGARLTLAIGLMGVALRLPKDYWRKHTRFFVLVLVLGMPLMWVIASGLLWWWLGLSAWMAFLIGAILTPTDPIVTTPIVTGDVADKNIPLWMQQDLSAESGANDGLGLPFVALPVYLFTRSSGPWSFWIERGWLYEVGVAAIVGTVTGLAAAWLLRWVDKHDDIRTTGYMGFTLALPIFVMAVCHQVGADGVLAAFVTGVVFDQGISDSHREHEEKIQEAVNKFFTISIFMLVGIHLPLSKWSDLALWWGVPAMAGVLILRRGLMVALVGRILRPGLKFKEGLFMAWFGPVGIAAVYYTTFAIRETGRNDIWPLASLAITVSVVLHGLTATPFSKWLGRARGA